MPFLKTLILNAPGQFALVDAEAPPPPGHNEAQVKVRRVGICGTDLHAFTGKQPFFTYPRVLGHELALEITALSTADSAHEFHVGDLCCVRPYLNCGTCGACQRGFTNACTRMQVLGVHRDGGMREAINVPIDKLHRANGLTVEELALVEMVSIGAHAVQRAQIIPGETGLVVGMGPIGLGTAQCARLAGARVIALDISEARLNFAREQAGIEQVIDGKTDVVAALKVLTGDDLPTVVFDATGNAASMMQSFQYLAHGGRLVFVGLFQGDVTFNDPEFHRREMTLLASRNATAQDFEQVITAMERKAIDVRSWITHHASPEQLPVDFPQWLDPANGVIKAMLSF